MSTNDFSVVCGHSSQARTLHPQRGSVGVDVVMTPAERLMGVFSEDLADGAVCSTASSVAASKLGIQRKKGVRSGTSTMYQSFLAESQRAPSAFAASFSAKGVTKLILILQIITASGFMRGSRVPYKSPWGEFFYVSPME